MTPTAKRGLYRYVEWLLWTAAVLCFGVIAWACANAIQSRVEEARLRPARHAASAIAGGAGFAAPASKPGEAIGRVEIPALRLSVPITAGIDGRSLLRGVGHVEGSAVPGGLGTMVLAGHRDTYLRPLENVRAGMEIRVVDRTGTFHYTIDRWEVVLPEQVDAIAIRSRPELALVTCYPFHFVGAAPKRFIVHAHLDSVAPDAP